MLRKIAYMASQEHNNVKAYRKMMDRIHRKVVLTETNREEDCITPLIDTLLYSDSAMTGEGIQPHVEADSNQAITEISGDVAQEVDGMSTATKPMDTDFVEDTVSIEKYLTRPIRIDTTTWNTGDFLRKSIDPWSLYLNDVTIRRKIDNYAYFRGTLKVKVTINGNPFYYGRGIMSYNPYGFTSREIARSGSAPTVDNVRFSQRPHVILNPTESAAGELTLPFVFPLAMAQRSTSTDVVSSPAGLGRLNLSSFNPLRHSNGITSSITITTFAWFEDIKLGGPTNIPIPVTLPLQSDSGDEYGEGVVSRPASALARLAGQLTEVPVLGPYAMATQMGASTVSKVASLFGYCRPTNLNPINKFKPTFMGNVANSCIPDVTDKLTFDPKQELSIDPNLLGVLTREDELAVKYIAQKESYLTRFQWQTADAADQLLFWSRVGPYQFTRSDQTSGSAEHHLTPLFLASAPFRNWRGSIIYRFQLAISNFHKGRLRLVYDPLGSNGAFGATPPDFASVYTRILDISVSKEFEIVVGWNQPIGFRLVDNHSGSAPDLPFSPIPDVNSSFTVGPVNTDISTDNGSLAIYVLNELTTPNTADTSSPQVNVFVRGGPDIEFANPYEDNIRNFSVFSGNGSPNQEPLQLHSDSAMDDPSELKKVLEPIGNMVGDNDLNVNYFGETFTSFRDMMKRFQFSQVFLNPFLPSIRMDYGKWRVINSNFPLYRGADPAGDDEQNGMSWTYSKNTLINWLTPAYVCRRGGIRWKYNFQFRRVAGSLNSNANSAQYMEMLVNRYPVETGGANNQLINLDVFDPDVKGRFTQSHPSMWDGGLITNISVNPTLEFEVPYYTGLKFNAGSESSALHQLSQKHEVEVYGCDFPANKSSHILTAYVATGEDFNLSWFINAPVLYFAVDNPD